MAGASTSLHCYKRNKVAGVLCGVVGHGPVDCCRFSHIGQALFVRVAPWKGRFVCSFLIVPSLHEMYSKMYGHMSYFRLVCVGTLWSVDMKPLPCSTSCVVSSGRLTGDRRALRLREFSVNLCTYCEAYAVCGISGVIRNTYLVPGRARGCVCRG